MKTIMVSPKHQPQTPQSSLIWARLLGGIFILMAVTQLISWEVFSNVLYSYRLGPEPIIGIVAGALIGLELLVGISLQSKKSKVTKYSLWAAVGLISLWLVMIIIALVNGVQLANSGFFGGFVAQPVQEWILLEVVFILGAVVALLIKVSNQQKAEISKNRIS